MPNTRREDWCGPRRYSSPEAAAWWSDRRAAYLTQQTKRKHFLHFSKFLESKIQRENDGGAVMTSSVQEPATATIDEAVASISFSAVALPSTTMPTFFPAAADKAVL